MHDALLSTKISRGNNLIHNITDTGKSRDLFNFSRERNYLVNRNEHATNKAFRDVFEFHARIINTSIKSQMSREKPEVRL